MHFLESNISGGTLCIFVPIIWMCKKQTSVSHSSTESEIVSLDAGVLMDGLPPGWQKLHAQTVVRSFDMEGHARTFVEGYCELANKKSEATLQQSFADKKNSNQL